MQDSRQTGSRRRDCEAEFLRAGTIQELKSKGRLVVRGAHHPILVLEDGGRIFALDNRCPHMGFPLDRGSIEDGILTCHWHTRDLILRAAAPSIFGRTMCRAARLNSARGKYGCSPNSGDQMPLTGGSDSNRAWPITLGSLLPRPYRVN